MFSNDSAVVRYGGYGGSSSIPAPLEYRGFSLAYDYLQAGSAPPPPALGPSPRPQPQRLRRRRSAPSHPP